MQKNSSQKKKTMLDGQRNILIVDDDNYTLEMIMSILERNGYNTRGVRSGKKALEIAKNKNPDLLLLDINLPDIDGYDVCKDIKSTEETKEIPVVFITGNSGRQSIQKSFEAGGSDYVGKPFVIEEVLARISMAIDNARAKKVMEQVNKELEQRVALQTRRLNLLFSITKLATESLTLEQILQKVVLVLDKYMSYLGMVSEIQYRGKAFRNKTYEENRAIMKCELKVDHRVGKIVLYSIDESESRALDVKQESKDLLEAVANEVNKIIKQKESEEKVKTQWKYYRALKDNSPEGIVTLDQDRKVVDINQAFKKIFGYSLDSIKGKHLENFILPKRLKEEGQAIIEKIKKGDNIFRNSVRKTKENKEIHCSIIGAPININSQHMDYFLIYRDITREKKLEVQLMQTNKMEAIGQLAAGIAHEINTPTQYVNSNIEFFTEIFPDVLALIQEYGKFYSFIKESYDDKDEVEDLKEITGNVDISFLKNEVKEALKDSLEGLNKISNIVDAMRTFSHPGTKDKQEINVNKLIQKTITVTRNEWKYDAELKTDLEDNIEPIPIHQDQISQVMLNLIVNATHAIQSASESKKNKKGLIKIRSRSKKDYLEIKISDDGTGIPKNIRDKVFNPFFTTKDVGEGTGQGLSMAYNVIVENHRGNIYFDTEMEKGTTFIIELPRKRKLE